jgi:hypothetical protein
MLLRFVIPLILTTICHQVIGICLASARYISVRNQIDQRAFSREDRPLCPESAIVSTEPFETNLQPGVAERALDTATDVSRTLGEVTGALRAAVDRLSVTIEEARRPGTALSTVAAITREAPLASLFVAFLFGIAVARRR